MYPEYPHYPAPVYPPPPRPAVRQRPSLAARIAVSLLAMLLMLGVALGAIGLTLDPQTVARLLPLAATRLTGTIYGLDLARREAGYDTPMPLAGASIACGGVATTTDARGHYSLALLKGRGYTCEVSAPNYTPTRVALSPHFASAFRLDLGPASIHPAGAQSPAFAACAVTATTEACPALPLLGGVLSGQVTDNHSYAPLAGAQVICWDNGMAARGSASPPARYTATADAQGRYSLPNTPPGPYLCVANQQGVPQSVTVRPATTSTLNFFECNTRCGGMTYHNGPVMHTFTAYVIFWAPPGVRFEPYGSNERFQSLVRQYLSDVGGTSFYGLLTQYWDLQGPVRNVATLGGTYLDAHPYPHAGTRANPLSDSDITAEISRVRRLEGWSVTSSSAFIVLTGYNVQECAKFSNGSACSFPGNASNGFCAYHSFTPNNGGASGPQYMPYLYAANNANCVYLPTFGSGAAPYGDENADAVINSLSHEQFETVTDPETGGWYDGDPSGGEIGDKCETTFGPVAWDGSTVTLNHGHSYVLQEEYSNRAGGCAYR